MKKRHSFEFVKKYIEENSKSILLSDTYTRSKDPLKLMCKCEEVFWISFDKFKSQNKRNCNKCSGVYVPTIEEIDEFVKINGCKLVSTEYINKRSELKIVCHCGNSFDCTYEIFKNKKHKSCVDCNNERGNVLKRTRIEEVRDFIIKNSLCTPLFKSYKNNRQPLLIQCQCGRKFKKNFHDFKDSHQRQCANCAIRRSRGEEKIERILLKYQVYYEFQYRIKECRNKLVLPFDFGIFSDKEKKDLLFLIEFQGEQHYKATYFGGTDKKKSEKEFKQRQVNDQIKRNFCVKNQIKLVEIPYWELKNIKNILLDKKVI